MNVEEAHRRAQEGVEHAVVQSLCRHHQDVEVNQAAQEAKQDGGRGQTWSTHKVGSITMQPHQAPKEGQGVRFRTIGEHELQQTPTVLHFQAWLQVWTLNTKTRNCEEVKSQGKAKSGQS